MATIQHYAASNPARRPALRPEGRSKGSHPTHLRGKLVGGHRLQPRGQLRRAGQRGEGAGGGSDGGGGAGREEHGGGALPGGARHSTGQHSVVGTAQRSRRSAPRAGSPRCATPGRLPSARWTAAVCAPQGRSDGGGVGRGMQGGWTAERHAGRQGSRAAAATRPHSHPQRQCHQRAVAAAGEARLHDEEHAAHAERPVGGAKGEVPSQGGVRGAGGGSEVREHGRVGKGHS